MDSMKRIEADNVEFTGGAMVLAYLAAAVMLMLQYIQAF